PARVAGGRAEGDRAGTAVQTQIFGFTDCQGTPKAQRFFKERGIAVHLVDLKERPAARGGLRRFAAKVGAAAPLHRDRTRLKTLRLRVAGDSPERLLERALTEPRLLRTPLVRFGGRVAVGHMPDTWQEWVDAARQGAGKPA